MADLQLQLKLAQQQVIELQTRLIEAESECVVLKSENTGLKEYYDNKHNHQSNRQSRLFDNNDNIKVQQDGDTKHNQFWNNIAKNNEQIREENNNLRNEVWQLNQKLKIVETQKQELTLKMIDLLESNKLSTKKSVVIPQQEPSIRDSQLVPQQLQEIRQSDMKDQEIAKLYDQLSEIQKINNIQKKYQTDKPLSRPRVSSEHKPKQSTSIKI